MEVSPEGPALAAVVDVEEDVEVLAQVGAHQTLHLDKQVMRARRDGSLFLPVPMLHLDRHTRTRTRTHTETDIHFPNYHVAIVAVVQALTLERFFSDAIVQVRRCTLLS